MHGVLAIFTVVVVMAGVPGGLGQVGLTARVRKRGGQARHADTGEVIVVLQLPRALVRRVEVRVHTRVVQVHAVAQVDVVEWRVAIDPLVGGGDAVEACVDGEVHAVGVVVDLAQQGLAGVLGVLEVHARVQADQVVDHVGVVEVSVVLVPDVLQLGGVQVGGDVLGTAPRRAGPVKVLALVVLVQRPIVGVDAAVAALVVRVGEAHLAAFEQQAVDAGVGQAHTTEGLRQHAGFAASDHRVGEEQVTGFQFGVERLELDRSTGSGERMRGSAQLTVVLDVVGQDAGAGMAATAVQLEAQHGMCIQAKADHARGVARLEARNRALAPLAGVPHASVVVVAVEVGITEMQVEGRAFDEAISLVFICLGGERDRCSQRNEQRGKMERGRHRY